LRSLAAGCRIRLAQLVPSSWTIVESRNFTRKPSFNWIENQIWPGLDWTALNGRLREQVQPQQPPTTPPSLSAASDSRSRVIRYGFAVVDLPTRRSLPSFLNTCICEQRRHQKRDGNVFGTGYFTAS
jgi:hypothetical protein